MTDYHTKSTKLNGNEIQRDKKWPGKEVEVIASQRD